MTSKRTQVSHPSFTQLIQSEKLTQNLEKNFNNPEQESSEEEELVFNKETRDVSPQPRPDLLAFLVCCVVFFFVCLLSLSLINGNDFSR